MISEPPPEGFAPLLGELDTWLREHRPDYYAKLQPPATDEQLAAIEAQAGAPLPGDLRALLRWKAGQSPAAGEPFYGDLALLQPGEIAEEMRATTELLDTGVFTEADWWYRDWVPFVGDAGGNYLCVDPAGRFGGAAGQVVIFSEDRPWRGVEYPSLAAWLSAVLAAFRAATDGTPPDKVVPGHPDGFPKKHLAT